MNYNFWKNDKIFEEKKFYFAKTLKKKKVKKIWKKTTDHYPIQLIIGDQHKKRIRSLNDGGHTSWAIKLLRDPLGTFLVTNKIVHGMLKFNPF